MQTSCLVRAKSTWDSQQDTHHIAGQLEFCAGTGRRALGTSVDKESPKIHLTSSGGGEVVLWVFPVLASSSQLLDNGVPGLVSGSQSSPAHFRETSTD